jgi:hypothetical protein
MFYSPSYLFFSMVHVRKFDGSLEAYDRSKVVTFCLRLNASKEEAEAIADRVEHRLYDGIPTQKLLQMLRREVMRYRPDARLRRDLRSAISLLRSKPDWELFVQCLLNKVGYAVEGNRVLQGKCVDNEIDGVLRTPSQTIMLEVKHHVAPHTKTSLDVPRVVHAVFEDLTAGYALGYHDVDFTDALIVCNTKFSTEGKRYAECRGIGRLCWKDPAERGLEALIEAEQFYPLTILRAVDKTMQLTLGNQGVIVLQQILEADLTKLAAKTGIREAQLNDLERNARKILQT